SCQKEMKITVPALINSDKGLFEPTAEANLMVGEIILKAQSSDHVNTPFKPVRYYHAFCSSTQKIGSHFVMSYPSLFGTHSLDEADFELLNDLPASVSQDLNFRMKGPNSMVLDCIKTFLTTEEDRKMPYAEKSKSSELRLILNSDTLQGGQLTHTIARRPLVNSGAPALDICYSPGRQPFLNYSLLHFCPCPSPQETGLTSTSDRHKPIESSPKGQRASFRFEGDRSSHGYKAKSYDLG
ncbi:hypothetical protein STEG23_032833, partial [Scotinomys teguina]